MQMQKELGMRLKSFRKKAGISQFELETRLTLSHGSISKIELGRINPQKETLLKISEELDLGLLPAVSLFNLPVEKKAEFLDTVRAFFCIKSVPSLFSHAVTNVENLTGYSAAVVFRQNKGTVFIGDYTKCSIEGSGGVEEGEISQWLSDYSLKSNEEINMIARVFSERKTSIVTDFRAVCRKALPLAYSNPLSRYFGFFSGIISPLIKGNTVDGAILLINREKREVGPDIPLAESYAALVSSLISEKEEGFPGCNTDVFYPASEEEFVNLTARKN